MARTINGKKIEDVLKELSAPFDQKFFEYNLYGYPYLPVEVLKKRLDDTVGILNYDVTVSTPEVVVVGTRPQVILKTAITLRDDNGNVVVTKESPGGSAIILVNETGEAVSVKNDEENAAHDAFKRCCKLFGMGTKQLKEMRSSKKSGNATEKEGATSAPTELYRVIIKEKFKTLGNKKNAYAAMVTIEKDGDYKLVIWSDAVKKIEETLPMEDFLRIGVPGKSFCLYGKKQVFTGNNGKSENQLVMTAPYCGGE